MADKGYESRFACYPCGKSLGGHMRSHVVANSAELQQKVEFNLKKNSSSVDVDRYSLMKEPKFAEPGNGQSGYGLRENPKKTWRAVDSGPPLPQDQVCKQCGKGFQSLKALCGHMACHSEKDKGMKDDNSWASENQKLVFDSQSDTEAEEMKLRTRSSKSKRYMKISDDSPFSVMVTNGSSSVSEVDGQEQKEVAMCLMLLSRDSGNKVGVDSVVESSDNNSVVETKSSSFEMRIGRKGSLNNTDNRDELAKVKGNESRNSKVGDLDEENVKMENSDSGYFLDEVRKSLKTTKSLRNLYDADDSMASKFAGIESRKRKYSSENLESINEFARMMKNVAPKDELCSNSQKKSKHECFNCKKVFKSYQALGGHRPCHNRGTTSYESRDESGKNSPDDSTGYRKSSAKKKSKAKKSQGHVCPFCNRVFKNGQALGGHKRTHFISGHDERNNQSPVVKQELLDLLDLNLPAPEAIEDAECGDLLSW